MTEAWILFPPRDDCSKLNMPLKLSRSVHQWHFGVSLCMLQRSCDLVIIFIFKLIRGYTLIIVIIIIIMALWQFHGEYKSRIYNIEFARQFWHRHKKIQLQKLFSAQFSLKNFHINSRSLPFKLLLSKKLIFLWMMFTRNPVLYQKLSLCASYRISGSITLDLLPAHWIT